MMIRRSAAAGLASVGYAILLMCQPATAQSPASFLVDLRAHMHILIQKSLATMSDELIASTIRDEDQRKRIVGSLFDTNLDPSATPTWTTALSWESGRLLSSTSILALWQSKKELVSSVLNELSRQERQALHAKVAGALRALGHYRINEKEIRSAFREQKDAYSLCEGKHDVSTQTLKNAGYRLSRLVDELGDDPGALTFADRLWNAGGYELLSAALTVANDLAATLSASQPVLESSLSTLPTAGLQ